MELCNHPWILELCNHPWISGASIIVLIVSSLAAIGKKINKREEAIDKCIKLIDIGLYTKAIKCCKSVAKKYKEPIIYRYLGRAYLQIGETQLAIESFKKVEELSNSLKNCFNLYIIKKAEFYEEFANILEDSNKIDEAILYYKKALEEQKKEQKKGKRNVNENITKLLQKVAELSEEKGNLDEAIDYYEELIMHLSLPKESSIDQNIAKKLVKLYEKKGNIIMANKIKEKIKEEDEENTKKEKEKNTKKEKEKKEETALESSTTNNPII